MQEKSFHREIAEKFEGLLSGAPYDRPYSDDVEQEASAIYYSAKNVKLQQVELDALSDAWKSVIRTLRQKGSGGEQKRQIAREDIYKLSRIGNFVEQQQLAVKRGQSDQQ